MKATQTRSFLPSALLASWITVASSALVVPTSKITSTWSYQGCYVDVGRTINDAYFMNSTGMTNEACVDYCDLKGFHYAGTEWYSECFCGNTLATGGILAAEADCTTACSGNSSQPCGGGNRLTLWHSETPNGPRANTGIADWPHVGCYAEVNGRALTYQANVPGNEMSGAKCTAACKAAGFVLAGTEYSGECWCGNKFENGGAPASDGCNMICNGNSTELCGGPNRLNVYDYKMQFPVSTSTSTSSSPSSSASAAAPNASSSSSTAAATTTSLAVSSSSSVASSSSAAASSSTASSSASVAASSSVALSSSAAASSSASVAASSSVVSSSSAAASSSTAASSSASVAASSSAVSSSSSVVSSSSAASSSSVVSSSTTSMALTTTSSIASAVPTAPFQPASIANYNWYGCIYDTPAARTFSSDALLITDLTLEKCQTYCSSRGYTYFGAEYSTECYCSNTLPATVATYPATDCNMLCGGNNLNYCGAGSRLSVYIKNGTVAPSSSSSAVASSSSVAISSTVVSVPATTSSAVASATGFPTGWTSQGCWVDGSNGARGITEYQDPDNQAMTQQSCAKICADKGYLLSGSEYSYQCFCGNSLRNGAAKAPETECNTKCSGDQNQICGGPNRLTVWSNGTPQVYQPPAIQRDGLNGTWTYAGCYEDNVNNQRTFPWTLYLPDVNSPSLCLSKCGAFGYAAGGLEYGEECYCGDPENIKTSGATLRPDSECATSCPGNATSLCGGGSRLTTYFWSGPKPLYSFGFPTGANAGTYTHLIGGVCIPLMTMETITGKITFLEKWGTGPANSTGAYELDLDLMAWRPMHVKTDIFCSAGVVLPDKAGRQLTIGGWSGDSTYGVRLYAPDGSPGKFGTNDWQENVNELKLQDGRWYPSAMVMANGSVLVVGGEEGSNGRPVPTLEVLPYTGGPSLYMDWLERTDPNNLYPFLAVLPSGGIFVSYWNEARILDENTFATKKILPNMPGAVHDALGGRTYPLEGTAVLLPQYAPYTENLGVLMCGGSTNGANALDNCVSTRPDDANPTWTLERMPSKRVMSCMAPLPDGTYLIANGAKAGVAGFGLASDPNLNAVLYDPKKDVGARMSIMANTTVARMYHSEAITLLDGRVLISGSDPQDKVNPQEYRVEVFTPPYLLTGKTRPTFTITNKDWTYGSTNTFTISAPVNGNIQVSLLGAVSSTHGNSMGARTLFPAISCAGTSCTVTAPPGAHIAPPGWYQMFVLDGGIPAKGVYVRIGGDPAKLGNWPNFSDFTKPGV